MGNQPRLSACLAQPVNALNRVIQKTYSDAGVSRDHHAHPRAPTAAQHWNVEVGHLDGHEENTGPENLIWNCRACNTSLGVVFN